MEHILLTLATLMMTGDVRADNDRVTVRAMNQRLQLTGWQATWEANAEIQPPMHPVPGGRMIALLKHGDDKRDLVLWSKEGHELARTKLTLTGEVTASRAFDKRLILTTASEVAEFDTANLHPGRLRKLNVPAGKDTKYLPGPTGVWVVNDQALFYFDLDGGTVFQFVTGGIHEALARAEEAAGDKDVRIGGGADTIRQYLREGLVDEMHYAVSPVLLGRGERIFDGVDLHVLGYACVQRVSTERATHVVLRWRRPGVWGRAIPSRS